jgi:flagellar basal-body rod protein FlgB
MVSSTGIQLFDGMYTGMGNVLDLVQTRQQITSANIANVDTPGYLAKELPFSDLLGELMERGVAGEDTNVRDRVEDTMTERPAPDFALDGNSVDVEREHVMMEENKVFYQAVAGSVSKRLALLRFAASDGKA